MTISIDSSSTNVRAAIFSSIRQDGGNIGDCEAYELSDKVIEELDACDLPFMSALYNLVDENFASAEFDDVIFIGETVAELISTIRDITNDTFLCELQIVDNFTLLFSCPATVCNIDCGDLAEGILVHMTERFSLIHTALESCSIPDFELCDLIGPGYKSGYGLSVAFMLLAWGL